MRLSKRILTLFAGSVLIAQSCKNDPEQTASSGQSVADSATPIVAKSTADTADVSDNNTEETLRRFLSDPPGYYGWQCEADKIMLDFFPDGRMPIQGPDGEATMWEGSWKLQGDQLTMDREDLNKKITVTVKIDGEALLLGDIRYTRYKP